VLRTRPAAQLLGRHANHFGSWDDWVSQERIRKLTDENKELAANLRKDMDAQRRAASGKPSIASATKKRGLGSEAPGSSARGSEDRSSVAPPPPPRGTKRAREIEGIDKVCFYLFPVFRNSAVAVCNQRSRDATADYHIRRVLSRTLVSSRILTRCTLCHLVLIAVYARGLTEYFTGRGVHAQTCCQDLHPRRSQIHPRRRLGESHQGEQSRANSRSHLRHAIPQRV